MKPVSNSLVLCLTMLARITALVLFSLGKCASECEPGALGRNENSAKIIDMDSSVPFKIRLADDWQKDKEMSTFIAWNRKWGPMKEFETYLTNPKREGVVIDVGGNIGVQTCHAAALGYRVFAFEPMPTLQKSLAFNVNNNCLGTKVTLVKIALSTQNSTLNMAYDSSDIGHTMVDKKSKGNGAIRTHRLDTYKPLMNEKIALMKVDVEGFECDVFGGAEGLLKSINAPPVILLECFPGFLRHFGCSVVQLFQMLDGYGYDLYAYNEKNQNLEGAAEYEREILPNERITPDMFASYEEKIYVYREIRGEKRGATTVTKDASSNNSSFAQFFKSRGQADIDVMVQSLDGFSYNSDLVEKNSIDDNSDSDEQNIHQDLKWLKHEQPVFVGGALGTCFDAVFVPTMNPKEKEPKIDSYTMYFSWRPKKAIASSVSPDGYVWDENPKVLISNRADTWEDDVNRPYVLERNGIYHMWYTGQAPSAEESKIGYAYSKDGLDWIRRVEPVLEPDVTWEKAAIMCTHVLYDEQKKVYAMWYSAGDRYEPDAIGYAESDDGISWEKYKNNPVFTHSPQSWWDSTRVTCPQVIFDGKYYNMFYIGFRDDEHAAIGIARSKDGVTGWERHRNNPIVFPTNQAWDSDAVYKPYTIYNGTHWNLWYNGRKGGLERIGMATLNSKSLNFDLTFYISRSLSPHMTNVVAQLPIEWKKKRIILAAIADDRSFLSASHFVESLMSFGYKRSDFLIICTHIECSNYLRRNKIRNKLISNNQCDFQPADYQRRCLISSGKTEAIYRLLTQDVTIFFFDLDVYFVADPLLNLTLDSNIELYAQDNEDTASNNNYNFGCFLVRPTQTTLEVFSAMRDEYTVALSRTWDQKLFNDHIIGDRSPSLGVNRTALFPKDVFFLFGFERAFRPSHANLVLVHVICVEGSLNKEHIASLNYGPLAMPSRYKQRKRTVQINYDFNLGKSNFNIMTMVILMIANTTQRAIILKDWHPFHLGMSYFNTDKLAEEGMVLLEDDYQLSYEKYNNNNHRNRTSSQSHESSEYTITISNLDSIDELSEHRRIIHVQNLILKFDPNVFKNETMKTMALENRFTNFVCPHHDKKAFCLRTCTGSHFR